MNEIIGIANKGSIGKNDAMGKVNKYGVFDGVRGCNRKFGIFCE